MSSYLFKDAAGYEEMLALLGVQTAKMAIAETFMSQPLSNSNESGNLVTYLVINNHRHR